MNTSMPVCKMLLFEGCVKSVAVNVFVFVLIAVVKLVSSYLFHMIVNPFL